MSKRHDMMRRLVVEYNIRSLSDYAEQLVAEALGGNRTECVTNKGVDVTVPALGRVEVKCRRLPHDGRVEERVSIGRSKDHEFDYLAVVISGTDLDIKGAVLVPHDAAERVFETSRYRRINYSQA
jgi:hypothetical protein